MKRLSLNQFIVLALTLGLGFSTTSCKKEENDPDPGMMRTATFNYEFNNGQVVPSAAYMGDHMDNFSASIMVKEKSDNMVEIMVTLENTVQGEMYMIHAHDAADPSTTPNGTPYNESPNADILVQMANGNGGSLTVTQNVNKSFDFITKSYEGFFVVHDPLQPVNTADISTYLVVGSFAREQTPSGYASATFDYDFNTGQLAQPFAYSGAHPSNLMAKLKLQETAMGNRVSVWLMNSMSGEMYMVHAHDAADPNNTPNGTPYDETPNSDILTIMINGNGGTAYGSQFSNMSVNDLSTMYEGFFVVHDPLQAINTADPTTYVVLGQFARN